MSETHLLSYELYTRRPTKRGNLRLVIDDDGAVRVQRNDAEPPEGRSWAADLPERPTTTLRNAPARLRKILDAGHFFEMDTDQVDERPTDGTIRVLRWAGEGGPRTVTIDRAKSPEFDQIVARLAQLTSVPGL